MVRRHIMSALVGGCVAMLVAFLWAAHAWSRWDALVAHTFAVRDELTAVRSGCRQAESGMRGYLASDGTPVYLEDYAAGVGTARAALDAFQGLTTDNPHQRDRVPALAAVMDAKFGVMDRAVGHQRSGRTADARDVIRSGVSRDQMRTIEGIVADARAEEDRLLAERQTAARRYSLYAATAGVVGQLLGLIAVAVHRRPPDATAAPCGPAGAGIRPCGPGPAFGA